MKIKKWTGSLCYYIGEMVSCTINWLPYSYPVYNWLMVTSDRLNPDLWLALSFDYPVIISELILLDPRYADYHFEIRVNDEIINDVDEFYTGASGYIITRKSDNTGDKRVIIYDGDVTVHAHHKNDIYSEEH